MLPPSLDAFLDVSGFDTTKKKTTTVATTPSAPPVTQQRDHLDLLVDQHLKLAEDNKKAELAAKADPLADIFQNPPRAPPAAAMVPPAGALFPAPLQRPAPPPSQPIQLPPAPQMPLQQRAPMAIPQPPSPQMMSPGIQPIYQIPRVQRRISK
ncbi:unnamed protein product [Notodromas monacha]|uniref:Uncharacterized protein n=1 Tax=Notodromas monacha TaxID=399045 RepID=A0A7R9GJH1_9CRUS|nr:unnamed protein product [Notodromas monacha]CAG0924974.1 unnamed protein product [Notodromas monacha]